MTSRPALFRFGFSLLLLAFVSRIIAAQPAVFPGAAWERIDDPASIGWSAAGLDAVRD
jgi:hypothetical protein